MATGAAALLLCVSSPYARRGALWEAYRAHYGQDGDPVLVWQADTRSMNPTVDEQVTTTAYEQEEAAAATEYGAEFRRDVESFVPREAVEACVIPDRRELPPVGHEFREAPPWGARVIEGPLGGESGGGVASGWLPRLRPAEFIQSLTTEAFRPSGISMLGQRIALLATLSLGLLAAPLAAKYSGSQLR
jgi:hypothetical protein